MAARRPALNTPRWRRLRLFILARDGYRCRSCQRPGRLECDHVRPVHKGGAEWDAGNLQALCRGCHIAKTRAERTPAPDPEREAWRRLITDSP